MFTKDDISAVILSRDVERLASLLLHFGEAGQLVRRLAAAQNVPMLVELLKKYYQKAAAAEVLPTITATADQYFTKAEQDDDIEYPPILQQLLITARAKVREKQALSQSLHKIAKANDHQAAKETVSRILSLADDIDKLYDYKKLFDLKGIIHQDLLAPADQLPATLADITQEINNTQARLSKNRAKLKNPKTYSDYGGQYVVKLRKKVADDEELLAQLKQKRKSSL
jgi:hypothetical protein